MASQDDTRPLALLSEMAMPRLAGAWDRIEQGMLVGIATCFFLLATGIMLAEAFSRAFLDHSYFWAEEAVRYLVVWSFFMSLGAAGMGGYHIRTSLLTDLLGHRGRVLAGAVAALTGLAFSVMLFIGALPQVRRYFTMGMLSESSLEMPMWILFLAMPLGAALFGLYYLRLLVRCLKGRDPFALEDETGAAGKF